MLKKNLNELKKNINEVKSLNSIKYQFMLSLKKLHG